MLMLLFYIGLDLYACDTESVIEVVPKVILKKIPHAPRYISGYLNLGGVPVPVIDLSELIEQRPSSDNMHTRIILIRNPDPNDAKQVLGVIAEKVTEMMEYAESEIIDSGLKVKKFPFLKGIFNYHETTSQFVHITDLFSLLQGELSFIPEV